MRISQRGIELLKKLEGFSSHAYLDKDIGGTWTLGYGFIKGVKEGDSITMPEADTRLLLETIPFQAAVNEFVHVLINQNQFDALCLFTYNEGITAFKRSTLLELLNQGAYKETVAAQFMRWNKEEMPDGTYRVIDGLTNRREKERELFLA